MRMTNASSRLFLQGLAACGLTALLTACSMFTPANTSETLTPGDRAAMTKRGKPPQVFGMTAYSSERGVIFASSFRQHQGHATQVDFASDGNTTTPVIGVNDDDELMLIDSSAAESWISVEAKAKMKGVVLMDPGVFEKTPSHVYDNVGGFAVVVPQFFIKKLAVESGVFYMRYATGPLGPLTRWEKSPKIDGVLGADFLRSFQFVRISLRGRNAILSATTPYPGMSQVVASVPLKNLNGGLAAEIMINEEKVVAMIDIAGDFEVALPAPEANTAKQVSIGDAVFRNVEVISGADIGLGLEPTPRIGRQLLEKFDLVLTDFGKQLVIEIPAK